MDHWHDAYESDTRFDVLRNKRLASHQPVSSQAAYLGYLMCDLNTIDSNNRLWDSKSFEVSVFSENPDDSKNSFSTSPIYSLSTHTIWISLSTTRERHIVITHLAMDQPSPYWVTPFVRPTLASITKHMIN